MLALARLAVYPHVYGEPSIAVFGVLNRRLGIPPQVRGEPQKLRPRYGDSGNTPVGTGRTQRFFAVSGLFKEYPRRYRANLMSMPASLT